MPMSLKSSLLLTAILTTAGTASQVRVNERTSANELLIAFPPCPAEAHSMLTLVAIKVDNSIWFEAKAVSNNFSLPPREKREGTNVQTPAPWRDVLETSPAGTLASRNP